MMELYWASDAVNPTKPDIIPVQPYLDPPIYFLLGVGMVFWLGLLLGLPKRYYIGGFPY